MLGYTTSRYENLSRTVSNTIDRLYSLLVAIRAQYQV